MGYIIGMDVTAVSVEGVFLPGAMGMAPAQNGIAARTYKYCQYRNAVPGTVGQVVGYHAPAGVATQGYAQSHVTTDFSDTARQGAGVLVAPVIALNEWCWVQVCGPVTLAAAFTGGLDGQALTIAGATDGNIDVVALVTDQHCATADDASAFSIIASFPY